MPQGIRHIAKVFFASPDGNLVNFQSIVGAVVSTTPAFWYMLSVDLGSSVLHIKRVWSTIVSSLLRSSGTSKRSYEIGSTLLFMIALRRRSRVVKKVEIINL